jgi:hypothetical protein
MNPETRAGTRRALEGVPYKSKGNGKIKCARLEGESTATTAKATANEPARRRRYECDGNVAKLTAT